MRVFLLADFYADLWLRRPTRLHQSDYRSFSRYLGGRRSIPPSVEPALHPQVPVAMPDSILVAAPHSTEPAERNRLPGTYPSGPIFGGRTISAMGNRPQDHMDRDLLLASLLRNRRFRIFRKQCRETPVWAPAVPACIQGNFQHRARQLIVLGSHHQHLIERMRDTIHLAAAPCQGEKMLAAMEACVPRGALFARTLPDPGHVCGYARLCPWCHARSVQRLYRQLLAGPCACKNVAGKHLIALRVRVEGGEELQADEVRRVRTDYRYKLRKVAGRIGIAGGVIIHQATPWTLWHDQPSEKQKIFAHIFTLIGLVASSAVDSLKEVIAEACSDEAMGRDYETAMLPAAAPQALRYLLFGSSYRFRSGKHGLIVNDRRKLRSGIQGAAALEPWFLFTERQAWSYAAVMYRTRLYDTFGNWHKSQAGRQQCSRLRHPKSEYGNENRQAAFRSENNRRHDVANDRHRQLVAVALPLYQNFKDATGKNLGSPALRKALNDAGHAVSDRDARWLAKELPTKDGRSGLEKFTAKRKLACRRDRESHDQASCQVAGAGLEMQVEVIAAV